jgi:hypothetical protein
VDLIEAILETHHIVVSNYALVLQTQDGCQVVFTAQWPVGIVATGWRDREALVEGRDQATLQQGVGCRTRGHTCQPQFLDPTILRRLEETLHTCLGLRTARQDQIDVQFLQGSTELRLAVGVTTTLALGLEDAVTVGVQSPGSAKAAYPPAEQVHVGLDRLTLVETGVNAAGGVVDHVDQNHRFAAALDPVMQRGIHLD